MDFKIACLTPIKHIKGAWENLSKLGKVDYKPDADYHDALMICRDNDVAFVNPNKMGYRMDEYFVSEAKLKYIVTASTGTNHIDLKAAAQHGTEVIALTTEMDVIKQISSTAEHALALTLSLIRNIPKSFDAVKQFEWNYQPFIGRQINKMTVGVIGCGRLGSMYVDYLDAMGASVLFTDPAVGHWRQANAKNVKKVDQEELLEESDIISLHVHVKDDTFRMVNRDFLSKCKKQPYLINTSRGDIVNEADVLESLRSGQIKGYAADVIADEFGSLKDSELIWAAKEENLNIIVTPHIGGMTTEAQEIAYNGVISILENKLCVK